MSIDHIIPNLINQTTWHVSAGPGNGSMILMYLGARIPRKRPRHIPASEPDRFMGEYSIFIEGCSWRLLLGEDVLGGSAESPHKIFEITNPIKDATITSISAGHHPLDLAIRFSSGHILQLFCDITAEKDMDNYSVGSPEGTWIVGPSFNLRFEPAAHGA